MTKKAIRRRRIVRAIELVIETALAFAAFCVFLCIMGAALRAIG